MAFCVLGWIVVVRLEDSAGHGLDAEVEHCFDLAGVVSVVRGDDAGDVVPVVIRSGVEEEVTELVIIIEVSEFNVVGEVVPVVGLLAVGDHVFGDNVEGGELVEAFLGVVTVLVEGVQFGVVLP